MTSQITLHSLPPEPTSRHFAEIIKTGGASDSASVFKTLRGGAFHAIAPSDVDMKKLVEFTHGGILDAPQKTSSGTQWVQRIPTTLEATAFILWDDLKGFVAPIAYVHEPLLKEAEITKRNLAFENVEGSIYVVYQGRGHSSEFIAQAIKSCLQTWHFLAFFTDSLRSPASVDLLVQNARIILVGAYDGESFLHWRKLDQ